MLSIHRIEKVSDDKTETSNFDQDCYFISSEKMTIELENPTLRHITYKQLQLEYHTDVTSAFIAPTERKGYIGKQILWQSLFGNEPLPLEDADVVDEFFGYLNEHLPSDEAGANLLDDLLREAKGK
ncbi:MAG: hypothetical protein ACTSUO_06400 [Candidatus Thorarchaeota archaeon]